MSTIPAAVVRQLRGASYEQLGGLAECLASAHRDPSPEQLGEWTEPLARFDSTRALLDRVGWSAPHPERDVEIDLDRHRRVITDVLRMDLGVHQSLATEVGDAAEGQRQWAQARATLIEAFAESAGLDLAAEVEQWITVPDGFLDLLLEALLSDMEDAAQNVEHAALDPDALRDALECFDGVRAALAAIGWGAVAEVDVDPHRDVLRRALAEALENDRGLVADAERLRDAKGAEGQRERARARALQIEAFMHEIGLEIPQAGERDA